MPHKNSTYWSHWQTHHLNVPSLSLITLPLSCHSNRNQGSLNGKISWDFFFFKIWNSEPGLFTHSIKNKTKTKTGAPGRLTWLSSQLLISGLVMRSSPMSGWMCNLLEILSPSPFAHPFSLKSKTEQKKIQNT